MKRRVLFCTLVVCLAATAASAARYAGRPLAEALRDLETRGLRLIYSDDVVKPSMIVGPEPRATDPRQILDELLREHGLRATDGPRGALVIVRDNRDTRKKEEEATTAKMPVSLAEIVVTPSRFQLLGEQPEQRQFLSRDEVRALPHLGDDLFRAIVHIPGATSSDVTARMNIRGGAEDEVLAVLDGAEIYDPYHLKDLFRAFSTIDSEAVGSVDVMTGGFPAQYGSRMSGVVDIATLSPEENRTEVGIGLLNMRALSYGLFSEGRGQWLLSVRRGYLREVLSIIDTGNDLDPRYSDLLGKVQWTLGKTAVASLHVLASRDRINMREAFDTTADAKYDDRYLWLNVRGSLTPRLFAQTVATVGTIGRDRVGKYTNEAQTERGAVDDRRDANVLALKNDLSFDVTPRNVLKAGVTVRRMHARFDYEGTSTIDFAVQNLGQPPQHLERSVHVRTTSTELAAYVADRMRLSERLVVELGTRLESESHTPDGAHVSPRVNVSWFASDRTIVRAAWGRFYQPRSVYELPVEDGVTDFEPAQRAEHRILGIEQVLGAGVTARLEAYDKSFSHLRPRFENLFDRLVVFPELRSDRIRIDATSASARGVELLLRRDTGGPWSGWLSYARSRVEDEIAGLDVPRSWDQRDTINFSANYRRGRRWNFNLAGTFHSGWPTTPIVAHVANQRVVSELGALNSDRFPAYKRVDFRASRSSGHLTVFVELFNVLNLTNTQRVNAFDFNVQPSGDVRAVAITEAVFGVVPSFGVAWRF